ncbi:MAG: phage portal protein [Loktanella sp.]|nr:phage portal protein [Loktanella sp.]
MTLLDRVRGLFSTSDKGVPAPGSSPGQAGRPAASYMRGGRGVTFAGWNPALRDANEELGEAWEKAAARTLDLVHNNGWIAGAVDQAVANTVGEGLRLKASPEADAIGMTDDQAREWSRRVERRFQLWARTPTECDIEGRRTFGQMQAAAFRGWLATGEVLAELPFRRRPWGAYGTKVRVLPPQRLSRKTELHNRLVNGVYTDRDGMPIGYLATREDPYLGTVDFRVRARDRVGRPRVVHIFDGAPGSYRGISPMTPALQVARQFDQLADATLMSSIVQALFAVTITGDEPTEELMQGLLTPQEQAKASVEGVSPVEAYLDAVGGYYDGATLDVGINGRLSHLFPGQEMKFHTNDNPGADYKAYSSHLLREIARCLGLTYESATGDYAGATYSSVRMATGEIFKITSYRRSNIIRPFCQAAYEAWLEEEIEIGSIPFPGGIDGFNANRYAACRAEWRGTPKPTADDLKTAKAHQTWREMGVMSDEMIANDLGVEIEDVMEQRGREDAMRTRYSLPDPSEAVAALPDRADTKETDDDPDAQ